MFLSDEEKYILEGKAGIVQQKAMELLVRYGDALGAEKLVKTNIIGGGTAGAANTEFIIELLKKYGSFEALFSEFGLCCSEKIDLGSMPYFSCSLSNCLDPKEWKRQGLEKNTYEFGIRNEEFSRKIGWQCIYTCAPYLIGVLPIKGEHCAMMESSAVSLYNSVFGAKTNTEGIESTSAAGFVGRIPYWGLHIDSKRRGTHLIQVEMEVDSIRDWGLLGYYFGHQVQEKIPVIQGITHRPNMVKLKHCGAAAASSGGVEMYHVVGVTPEATTFEEALGGKEPLEVIQYGISEQKEAYEKLNTAKSDQVDHVILGCPHYSLDQLFEVCKLLEGRRLKAGVNLWIFVPEAIKCVAERQGYTRIITGAGGILMTDTCPAMARIFPRGTRVAATDSAKQAQYFHAFTGIPLWFGSMEDCIDAALTGKWRGQI